MIRRLRNPNYATHTNLRIFGLVYISTQAMHLNRSLLRILMQEQEVTQFVGIRKLSEL